MRGFTGIIFKKELVDIFRDRRSILMTLLLPLVLYPLMFTFLGSQAANELDGPSVTWIAADGKAYTDLSSILDDPIFTDSNIHLIESGDPVQVMQNGEADIAAVSVESGSKLGFRLVYDAHKTSSSLSLSHVLSLLSSYNQTAQAHMLFEMHGISLDELAPLHIEAVSMNVEAGEESAGGAGMFLTMILPMLLVVLLSVGGMPTAVDLFAGEKERRTFEPLLCTGARRTDILAGKLGAVTVMSLLGAIASGAGLLVGYLVNPRAMTMGMEDVQGFALPPLTVVLVLLIIMAMAVFFSGLHILLSTYARSIKEASTYGSFVMLASYVPAFASMMKLGRDFEFWTAFVPVMNVTGSLKMVLGGINDPLYMITTLGVTAAFVALVLLLGRYMFNKENIMLRS
jgi:sodium transport system permease protein